VIKQTVANLEEYHCYRLQTKFYPVFFSRLKTPYLDEIIGDHQRVISGNISHTDQMCYICQILGQTVGQYINYLQISGRPLPH